MANIVVPYHLDERLPGIVTGPALPEGPLYLHVDVDVCDAGDVPRPLLFPTAGGPRLAEVVEAVRAVARTGRVVGVGLAATWRSDVLADGATGNVVRRLAAAASG